MRNCGVACHARLAKILDMLRVHVIAIVALGELRQSGIISVDKTIVIVAAETQVRLFVDSRCTIPRTAQDKRIVRAMRSSGGRNRPSGIRIIVAVAIRTVHSACRIPTCICIVSAHTDNGRSRYAVIRRIGRIKFKRLIRFVHDAVGAARGRRRRIIAKRIRRVAFIADLIFVGRRILTRISRLRRRDPGTRQRRLYPPHARQVKAARHVACRI